jgi:spermidine/putrescine transport system substrate-binding protein
MTRALIADDDAPPFDPIASPDGRLSRRRLLATALSAGGTLALSGASASLLSACGGTGNSAAQTVTPAQVRNARGTVRVLGWQFYDQPAQHAGAVKAKWSYITSGAEIATKIRPRGSYDVFTSTAFQMGQFLSMDRLVPIDTSLLKEYDHVAPILRDNPTWRGPDGKIYGVPLVYSAVYTPYLSTKVPEPKTAADLLRPEFRDRIGLVDDATQTIPQIARVLGKQGDPARLTEAEFAAVKDYLDRLRPQVRTIYSSGEEPSLLERGDISLALTSYGFALTSGIPDLKATFLGSLGFADGLSILDGADVAAAHSWIDRAISLQVQRQLAARGPFQPVRLDANSSLPPVLQKPGFSKLIEVSPLMTRPPLRAQSGVASLEDWASAWSDYKASFG